MSDRTPLAPGAGENPADLAEREARHQLLIDLLGAYADNELPPESTSQIEAHLVGCTRCRREVAVHQAVRRRLGDEPLVAAPPALRERIVAAIAAAPAVQHAPAQLSPARSSFWSRRRWLLIAAAGVVAMAAATSAILWKGRVTTAPLGELATAPGSVPLVRDALSDYRRVTAGDLPGRARDLEAVRSAVPFPIEPLRAPGVRLLAAWTTELVGEPAAVLAYRWDDRIVLEYLVDEERFFQHPAVRSSVRGHHVLVASDGAQGIAGWPTETAGALLVGDLPPEQLARLSTAEPLARSVGSSAQ